MSSVKPMTAPGAQLGESDDERHLLSLAAEVDDDIRRAGLLYDHPPLQQYLDKVGRSLLPPAVDGQLRFLILRSPVINAMALPNGSVYVSLGLLARIENEAQLAQMLAHEASHVIFRHSLAHARGSKAGAVVAEVAEIATLGIGAVMRLPIHMAVSGYSRSQEEEADRHGLQLARAAGYDATAAVSLYDTVRNSLPAALDDRSSIYASHPTLRRRSKYLRRELARAAPAAAGTVSAGELLARTESIQREYLRLLVRAQQFATAQESAAIIEARMPSEAWIPCLLGDAQIGTAQHPEAAAFEQAHREGKKVTDELVESFRSRRTEMLQTARQSYRRCADADPARAEAQRGIGLASHLLDDPAEAAPALRSYLAAA
ncbi:MAG TPA: M48 family metalloprotease, partial [Terriglobales bacterium]|nr:M48 family metalloprotease [Terriglobales bacterium]